MAWVDARGVRRLRPLAMICHTDLLASARARLCVACCDWMGRHLLTSPLPCVCSASRASYTLRASTTWLEPQPADMIESFVTLTHKEIALSWHGVPLPIFGSVYRGRCRQSEVNVTHHGFNTRSNRLSHLQNSHRDSPINHRPRQRRNRDIGVTSALALVDESAKLRIKFERAGFLLANIFQVAQ